MLTQLEIFTPRVTTPPLPLTEGNPTTDPIQIRNIDGLGPVPAAINSSEYGSIDGEFYTGSFTGKRNIVITIGLNPDWADQTVEGLRLILYSYFMPGNAVTLRFTSTHIPQVQIDGYVETMEPNQFSRDPEIIVSIICLKPAFVGSSATIVPGGTLSLPEGDSTPIEYIGSLPTGFVLSVSPSDSAPLMTDGEIRVTNTNIDTEIFSVIATVDSTKYFRLSTEQGKKYVKQIATPSGDETSILGKQAPGSSWMRLKQGTNNFQVTSTEPGLSWVLQFYVKYGGL